MDEQFRRDEADGVVTITLTRDDKRNAISTVIWDGLEDAARDLQNREDLKVMMIAAEGRFFTAGMDMNDMDPNVGRESDGVQRGRSTRRDYRRNAHHDVLDYFEQIEKPIVLAAHSHCLGLGIEMSASCDFRLASDAATFRLPEIPNLHVIPASGGISRLTRLIGPHWTRWLAMAGQPVDAHQALQIGLVHAVYPAAEFVERSQAFASELAGYNSEAVGLAKMAIDVASSADRRTARDFDRMAQTQLFMSDDFQSRLRNFQSK